MKKPINKHAKGKALELKVKKMQEEIGRVCFKPAWARFSKLDIFGADILCSNPNTGRLYFIQVKSNASGVSKAKGKFREAMPVLIEGVTQEIWLEDNLVWHWHWLGEEIIDEKPLKIC